MQILTKQLTEIALKDQYDLAIFTSGYEPRSTYLFKKKIKAKKKIIIGYESFKDHPTRKLNDNFYQSQKHEITITDGNNSNKVVEILTNLIKDKQVSPIRIFVDYSSMTRVWYGEILSFFSEIETIEIVEIVFGYSFGSYEHPPEGIARNLYVEPIDGFSFFSVPNKPSALIIGLGYERKKAFGLSEYFDAETFLFYNVDPYDKRFIKDIEEINSDLLEDIPEENIYKYPITDLEFTERELLSLCSYLKENFRIIVVPSGPKPFTLISLIVALKMKQVDVWRISQGDLRNAVQFKPNGKVSLYQITFNNTLET